ncbi:MAG: hypothetical protein Q7V40_23965, partial [Pseudolabrys sp.]|nr:hypothetical protein [Pseudolabrys sp.]
MRTNPTWGQLDKSDEARRQKLAAALAKRDNIKIDSVPAGYAHLIDKAVDGFKVMKERQSADRMTNTTAEVFGINTPIAKQPSITPTKSEPKIDIVPTRKVAPEIEPMKKSDAGDLNFNLADLLDSGTEAQPAAKMMANALDSPAEAPVLPAEPMEPNKLAYTPAPQAIGAPEPIKLADAIEPPRPPADIPPQVDAFSAQNAFSEPTRASATLPGSGVNQQRVARILSSPVGPIVERVANETGYPVEKVATFVDVESSGNPNAKTGRYAGLLQLDSKKFGDQVYDPEFNLRQGIKGLQGEESRFANNYGRPPTVNETYMGHQQGEGGLRAHLSNPDAPAWQNMASTGEGRQKGEGWARQAIWGNVPNAMKAKFGSVDNITSKD